MAGLPSTYSTQKWISARLLSLVESIGIRKFHIRPARCISEPPKATNSSSPEQYAPDGPISSLLVWVFTPDLLFASSIPSSNRSDPTRSMKIFYRRQVWVSPRPGEPESANTEDLEFSGHLYEELDDALRLSQRLLPPMSRTFQGWNVALLERFDVAEVVRKP